MLYYLYFVLERQLFHIIIQHNIMHFTHQPTKEPIISYIWFSTDDGTIAAEKYHGIQYPNQTKIADTYSFCLSMCSVDQSCIALHYDRQSMQCHLSSLPLVYMLPYDVDEEFRTARVKNVAIHQLQVDSYQNLAGGISLCCDIIQ